MYKQASQILGRYEDTDGGAMNVAITKVYGGVDPYELILFYFPDKNGLAKVIHRVVLDKVGVTMTQAQGQNRGIHGVDNFTEERIKDMELVINPMDFCSARGQALLNIEVVLKEYR